MNDLQKNGVCTLYLNDLLPGNRTFTQVTDEAADAAGSYAAVLGDLDNITASTINAGNITSTGGLVDLNASVAVNLASGKIITTKAVAPSTLIHLQKLTLTVLTACQHLQI